jgi:hypothetical protein
VFTRGRWYDHNFLRFLTIFGEKIGVFLENQCYDQNFAYFSFVLSKKRQFFSLNFSAKIFKKIISSFARDAFKSSVFYVGKGTRSRPFQHLYDAVKKFGRGSSVSGPFFLKAYLHETCRTSSDDNIVNVS